MSDTNFQLLAIGVYFLAMIGIGYYAFRKTSSHEDYMLAGRGLNPMTAALSAGASDMSGWLMMGLPGAIYAAGLIEAWIAIGLTVGAYLNWLVVAPRLRAYTEVAQNSITIPSFFENRLHDRSRLLRIVSGLIILIFFTFYVSSGMVAGGVFFESSFDSNYQVGMLLVAGVTLLYTLFGGFLGASLTDVVQGLMMVIALVIVPLIAFFTVGGLSDVQDGISESGAELSGLFPANMDTLVWFGIISSLAWGLGYVGQPHIIVRFMALRSVASAKPARRISITWMIVSLVGAVVSGFIGIAYIQRSDVTLDNPETIVLVMSQALLHPFIAGLVLAAVLAAIMSTLSSQLIVCSSALVEDLYRVRAKEPPSQQRLVLLGRLCVLGVALVAILLALNPNDTILELVGFAWAGFGAAFGPIVLLSLFWRKLSNWGALVGMITGAVTVFLWDALEGWTDASIFTVYEILPGFLLNLVVAIVVSNMTYQENPELEDEFDTASELVTSVR
ncbi:sodium/proline symporter PutP [Ornithinimicrobium ciconiae]|uniref:Sodium/proline symporter n=1 Tax=Ornithinimicrobium ciconiae TaxID=2594265 RepID=A0A516G6B9_9MICO|nr:sodium/proline symporter PutP [Ornithinimicrobium ciconiae]QDO87022.1 sodium/proline symporter PutP [Ornithinimicrobium ciconiae]